MRLLPREEKYFEYFERQTTMIREAAVALRDAIQSGDASAKARRLDELEVEGDGILRDVTRGLQLSFITPLDAEDIHRVASALDRVLDSLENLGHQIALYKVLPLPQQMVEVAKLCVQQAEELHLAQAALGRNEPTSAYFDAISKAEGQADSLTSELLTNLFDTEDDIKRLIKLKELIQSLEKVTDRFLIAANVIENVYIKNS